MSCVSKRASIYLFGDPNSARPVLRDVDWTVREGESWAVVGSSASEKTALLEVPSCLFPSNIRISCSFAHRQPAFSGGAFYDYTAWYGAVREEDRVTLRQSMFPEESGLLIDKLELGDLLDLPLVALTGLDFKTRPRLLSLLHSLHASNNSRIIIGLRLQDPIPEWITHIALAQGGRVLVDMQNVNVRYHERHVLKDINWTICSGDRWHLQGANGSGKTTLLSVLTDDHPQSYSQRAPTSALTLFGIPRVTHATVQLRSRIGVVSPELFVPLGPGGLGVGVGIGMHRDGGELNEGERKWCADRVWEVLRGEAALVEEFARPSFAELPAGVQSIVLLMRALVGRPLLVLLNEVWASMDEGMVRAPRAYLREGGGDVSEEQAVIVGVSDGVKRFKLENGVGTVTMA
ncbi:P-loop containing nucleoside triphosphate hydrolase protein [Multifurca ochricompacta]|uniref:P-loop containing nucleoside triphosphate hydrolase protein n=1 Tax=Multifurca ochricompacta TaxID=376703 RepID=A0AAD4QLT8_9AGAM|nr:P-loop containing nucleoside triphosphate hydrolase protein [Multifurca ochricompacta]